jgi:spore germination protein
MTKSKQRTVTMLQFSMSLGTTIIGVGVLAFPRITVEYASTGAPLCTIAAVVLMMLCGLVLAYLGSNYPDQTLFEYADTLIGKWIGGIILACIIGYFMELAALAAREFGEVVVTSVLKRTPLEVTTLIMLILAATAARNSVSVFTRILTFYMPLVYFPALIVVALTLKSAEIIRVMPMFGFFHESTPMQAVQATLVVAALFQNYIIIGLLIPYMYRPKEAWKSALIGIGVAGFNYTLLIYATLAVFGTEEIKNLLWPTLELAKTAALPLLFLERMDPIFLAVWVTAVFTAILASYYVSMKGLAHMFRFENHRVFSLAGVPIVYLLAMQPPNIVVLYRIVKIVGISGLSLTIGYPFVLLLLHSFHKLRKKRKDAVRTA